MALQNVGGVCSGSEDGKPRRLAQPRNGKDLARSPIVLLSKRRDDFAVPALPSADRDRNAEDEQYAPSNGTVEQGRHGDGRGNEAQNSIRTKALNSRANSGMKAGKDAGIAIKRSPKNTSISPLRKGQRHNPL